MIEKEFFEVFEIPPATVSQFGSYYFWDTIDIDGLRYPIITDRLLLELICCLANNFEYIVPNVDYNNLKSVILRDCIKLKNNYLKDDIQEVFKECRW